ncbi:MAG: hypothetical protein R3D30_10155 [Hyphomicrobiales bacterium]
MRFSARHPLHASRCQAGENYRCVTTLMSCQRADVPWQDRTMTRKMALALGAGLILATVGQALAQKSVEVAVAQPQTVAMPDAEKIVLLLRNSLVTLNNAVQSGNFTVLRDVAAPGFREANSAAKLAQIFANLSAQKVDLAAVAVIAPKLTQSPQLDQAKGMLHLQGYFPGQPVQINFELLYQAVNGQWRLFGISVQPGASTQPALGAEGADSTPAKKK